MFTQIIKFLGMICCCMDLYGLESIDEKIKELGSKATVEVSSDENIYNNINNVVDLSRSFDMRQSLDTWPVISSLITEEEKAFYNMAWDPEKTLRENRKNLMMDLLENCFDFSFKLMATGLQGICVGKIDTGKDFVFVEEGIRVKASPDSEEVFIYNEKESFKWLSTSMATNIFLNIEPLSMTDWMKKAFERFIMKIEEDSVGCELLRLIVARYKGSKNPIPKLTVIPVANKEIGLSYTTGSTLWKFIKHENGEVLNKYRKISREWKFLMFSPNWFNVDQVGILLKKKEENNFSVEVDLIPREVGLLHQIIYAINANTDNEYREIKVIRARSSTNYFYGDIGPICSCIVPEKQLNSLIFVDDKVYKTMFGLTSIGLDPINEARYTAHRYGSVRLAYLGCQTHLNVNGIDIGEVETRKFLINFLQNCGDKDLYNYYLFHNSFVRQPEFGVGAYKYKKIAKVLEENSES